MFDEFAGTRPVWCMVGIHYGHKYNQRHENYHNNNKLVTDFMLKLASYLFILLVIMDLTSGQNKENSN